MNKNCCQEKYYDLIEDRVENELDEQNIKKLDSHILECSSCRDLYERLKREKEIYACYLFAVEPPSDLQARFESKLATEKDKTPRTVNAFIPPLGRHYIFSLLSRFPVFAAVAAGVLLTFGISFVWLKINMPVKIATMESLAENSLSNYQAKNPTDSKIMNAEKSSPSLAADDSLTATKRIHQLDFPESKNRKNIIIADFKSVQSRIPKSNYFTLSRKRENDPANSIDNANASSQKSVRLRQLRFETETAEQIEKVEILLRSFRNINPAKTQEGIETFDVDYERRQARKLLESNGELRLASERNGNLYAEELLSRAEPYLLDIANLEENPQSSKVLEIVKRVKDQNIISSLQVY